MSLTPNVEKDYQFAETSIDFILDRKLDHVLFVDHLSVYFNGLVTTSQFDKDGEAHKKFQEKTKALNDKIQPIIDELTKQTEELKDKDKKELEPLKKIQSLFPLLQETLKDLTIEKIGALAAEGEKDGGLQAKTLPALKELLSNSDHEKSLIWQLIIAKDYSPSECERWIRFYQNHLVISIFCELFTVAYKSREKRGHNTNTSSEEDVKELNAFLDIVKDIDDALEKIREDRKDAYFPGAVEKLMKDFIDQGQQNGIYKEEMIVRELHNRFYWDDFLFMRWNNMNETQKNWKHFQHWSLEQEGIDSVSVTVSNQIYMVVRMKSDCGAFRDADWADISKMIQNNHDAFRNKEVSEILDDNRVFERLTKKGNGLPWFTFGLAHFLPKNDDPNKYNDLIVSSTNSAKFDRRTYTTEYKQNNLPWPFPDDYVNTVHREYIASNTA